MLALMSLTPNVMTVSRGTGGVNCVLMTHLFRLACQNRLSWSPFRSGRAK